MGIGIWGNGSVPQTNGTEKAAKAYKGQAANKVQSKKDDITISENAKDISTIMKTLKNVPEIREDKVKEISEKIETGEYNVKEEDLAEKIFEHFRSSKEERA